MPVLPDKTRTALRLGLCSVGELFGGVERQLLGLCTYLRRRDLDPVLILFHDGELAARARELGVEPLFLPARHSFDLGAPRRLGRLLADRGINVVHVHGYRATVNCALARRWHRFAVIKTEHGRTEPGRSFPFGGLKPRLYAALEAWATRQVDADVCYVTEDLGQHFAREHGSLRRQTVYNGIDPLDRAATSAPPEFATDAFDLVLVGRVTEVKGITFALQAMAGMPEPARHRLHVIGSGPLQEALEREAAALGLAERVRFLGFRRNVLDYLAHCDALLMPSLHEGLPYTLLEAMSLGTPVLASRVGGLAEILHDGKTALLFPPRYPGAVRAAVGRLVADADLGRALGRAARQDQRARFTLQGMGDAYWRLYEAAVAGENNAG